MNYLAHASLLETFDPALVLGAALPDLVRAFDRRASRVALETAQAIEARGEVELARGIRAHHAADVSFHGLLAFKQGCRELAPATLAVREAGAHVRGFFLTHILLEVLLDAALIERDPGLIERVDAALEPALVVRASAALERAGFEARGLEAFATRFREARVFRDYTTDPGVAHRISQVLARARQPLSDDAREALANAVGALRPVVARRVDELCAEPREAVARAIR